MLELPYDGDPGEKETPQITAASYRDAEVAQVPIAAGADLEATAADDAGGVPGGTALQDPYEPEGLLEPDARKRARPVLRGAGRSNAPGLPDSRERA